MGWELEDEGRHTNSPVTQTGDARPGWEEAGETEGIFGMEFIWGARGSGVGREGSSGIVIGNCNHTEGSFGEHRPDA